VSEIETNTSAIRALGAAFRSLARSIDSLRLAYVAGMAEESAERRELIRVLAEQRDAFRALAPDSDEVGDAADAVKIKALGKVGRILDIPGRVWDALAWAVASPKNAAQAVLTLGGAVTIARVLSGIVPGLEPVADALQAGMDAVSPHTGTAPP